MKLYLHPGCSTCKKAVAWLDTHKMAYESIDIREHPPSIAELRQMHQHVGKLSKLFNTSGMDYRKLGLKDQLPGMSDDDAYARLHSNGMLVKRPFLLTPKGGVTGFREATWQALFEPTANES